MELLAGFDLDIIHRPGKLNKSDPLSRRDYPDYTTNPDPDLEGNLFNITEVDFGQDFVDRLRATVAKSPLRLQQYKRAFRFQDGLWTTEGRLFIPEDDTLKEDIMRELHDAPTGGHFGFDKTLESVARRFWWPTLRRDVQLYCQTCPTCQRTKASNQLPAGLLQPLPTPDAPWEQVTMDLLFSLPTTAKGHTGLVVFVDRLTKYFRVAPCNVDITAEGVASAFLDSVVRHHGVPKVLISDRDPRFVAGFWRELQRALGTTMRMSTAGHPETDGQTENANRTLLRMLRSYCQAHPQSWDSLLSVVELAYNAHKHASTGVSPFYANFGRHPVMPMDLLASFPLQKQSVEQLVQNIHDTMHTVKQHLAVAQQRQAKAANRRRRHVEYVVGDKVLVKSDVFHPKLPEIRKLLPAYMGPFTVARVTGPSNVKLDLPEQLRTLRVVHISRIKPFHETLRFGNRGAQPPALDAMEGDPEWEVQALLARKRLFNAWYYLVHWKGYDHCEDCWICEDYLQNCTELIRRYDAAHPR
jgi:hypothetical protein